MHLFQCSAGILSSPEKYILVDSREGLAPILTHFHHLQANGRSKRPWGVTIDENQSAKTRSSVLKKSCWRMWRIQVAIWRHTASCKEATPCDKLPVYFARLATWYFVPKAMLMYPRSLWVEEWCRDKPSGTRLWLEVFGHGKWRVHKLRTLLWGFSFIVIYPDFTVDDDRNKKVITFGVVQL